MHTRPSDRDKPQQPRVLRDPVCGLRLNPRYLEYHTVWQGRDYYFCSMNCKMTFDRDPWPYLENLDVTDPGTP